MGDRIQSFTDLTVWKEAHKLVILNLVYLRNCRSYFKFGLQAELAIVDIVGLEL